MWYEWDYRACENAFTWWKMQDFRNIVIMSVIFPLEYFLRVFWESVLMKLALVYVDQLSLRLAKIATKSKKSWWSTQKSFLVANSFPAEAAVCWKQLQIYHLCCSLESHWGKWHCCKKCCKHDSINAVHKSCCMY